MSSPRDLAAPERDFDALVRKLSGVEGLYDGEAWELAKRVRDYPPTSAPLTIVEVASWKGRSTICLAFGLGDRPGMVHAIDPHSTSLTGHAGEYGGVDTYAEFLENIRRAGFEDRVSPVRAVSADAAARFKPGSIHVLFVDGAHEYEYVVDDIGRYEPLLADRAVVVFNEPSRPGVFRALKETVLREGSAFLAGRLVQNTVFFDYDRNHRSSGAERKRRRSFTRVLEARALAARFCRFMPMPVVRLGHRLSAVLAGTKLEHV